MGYRSVESIAEEMGVTIRVIRAEIKRGDLEAIKIGKEYRISDEDFNKWIEKKRVGRD